MEPSLATDTVDDPKINPYAGEPISRYIGSCYAYAITISPPSRIGTEYVKIGNTSYKYGGHLPIFHDDYRVIIRALRHAVDFVELYPEISLDGRLHYHGVINIKDMIKWYKTSVKLLNRLGFIKLCKFKSHGWIKYIRKDWEITKIVLELNYPILTDMLSLPLKEANTTTAIREQKRIKKKQSIHYYFPLLED